MVRERGSLPHAYLRIDPNIDQTHPDPGEFLRLLCAADRQPSRGRFKSEEVLRNAIGRRAASLSMVRYDVVLHDGSEEGCLDGDRRRERCPEGPHLYVAGWDDWQEGDHTVGERMSRYRSRKKGIRRNSTVTGYAE